MVTYCIVVCGFHKTILFIINHLCLIAVVTLHGVVERAYERSSAEATVRQVSGVMDVKNEIAIGSAKEVSQAAFPSWLASGEGPVRASSRPQRFARGS